MNVPQERIHHLINQLDDSELENVWSVVHALYCDFYTLKAIQEVKRSQQPWDTLTNDEALGLLMFRPN